MADRHATNEKHLAEPMPGDYWHDMYSPVCVVLKVSDGMVMICDKQTHYEDGRWAWDLLKRTAKTLEEFRDWLSYGTIPGTWARVIPEAHKCVLEHLEVSDG